MNPLWVQQPGLKIRIIISENSERSLTSGMLGAGCPVLSTSCTWFHFVMLFAVWNKCQTVNQCNTRFQLTLLLAIKGATFFAAATAHEPSIYTARKKVLYISDETNPWDLHWRRLCLLQQRRDLLPPS